MSGSPFIPRSDAGFQSWQENLITKVAPQASAWNIPPDAITALQALKASWTAAHAATLDPATRTSVAIYDKQNARAKYEAALRKFNRYYLANNPAVTDHDLKDLGLTVPKRTHTHAPVAAESPDCDVDTSVAGRLTFHFFEKGSSHKKAKPPGQHGAEIAWVILDAPPTRWEELIHSSFDTHPPMTLSFEGNKRGKTLYYALRWENTRGEKGPWSNIRSAIIP
jgi:hypothetical protein